MWLTRMSTKVTGTATEPRKQPEVFCAKRVHSLKIPNAHCISNVDIRIKVSSYLNWSPLWNCIFQEM